MRMSMVALPETSEPTPIKIIEEMRSRQTISRTRSGGWEQSKSSRGGMVKGKEGAKECGEALLPEVLTSVRRNF